MASAIARPKPVGVAPGSKSHRRTPEHRHIPTMAPGARRERDLRQTAARYNGAISPGSIQSVRSEEIKASAMLKNTTAQ